MCEQPADQLNWRIEKCERTKDGNGKQEQLRVGRKNVFFLPAKCGMVMCLIMSVCVHVSCVCSDFWKR